MISTLPEPLAELLATRQPDGRITWEWSGDGDVAHVSDLTFRRTSLSPIRVGQKLWIGPHRVRVMDRDPAWRSYIVVRDTPEIQNYRLRLFWRNMEYRLATWLCKHAMYHGPEWGEFQWKYVTLPKQCNQCGCRP